MPLRSPNDQDPANLVMEALQLILPGTPSANTLLGQAAVHGTNSAINSWSALYGIAGAGAVFPFLMLEEDRQSTERISFRTWHGDVVVLANYINRWDRNPATIDAVWAIIDTDLRRMKANLEDNPTLSVQITAAGELAVTRHAVKIHKVELSPYKGSLALTIFPFGLVARTLSIHLDLPTYTGAF